MEEIRIKFHEMNKAIGPVIEVTEMALKLRMVVRQHVVGGRWLQHRLKEGEKHVHRAKLGAHKEFALTVSSPAVLSARGVRKRPKWGPTIVLCLAGPSLDIFHVESTQLHMFVTLTHISLRWRLKVENWKSRMYRNKWDLAILS